MRQLLFDTSAIIDFLRRKDKENCLFYTLSEEDIAISMVTHTELYAGKSVWEHAEAREALDAMFSGIHKISLTEEVSERAGRIKAHGSGPSLIDSIIAATAIIHKRELVTLNRKHFEDIPHLSLFT